MELILIAVVTIILLAYFWIKKNFNYWKDKGITTYSSTSFTQDLFSEKSFPECMLNYYQEFKSKNLRHGGVFLLFDPYYIPIDLEITKSIMENDFNYFVDTGGYVNETVDPLSAHLVNLEGRTWKTLRTKLTPAFTVENIRMMFETVMQCTNGLSKAVENELGNVVDFQDISVRFATDVMGSCAFGFECNTLENPDSKFWKMTTSVFGKELSKNLTTFMISAAPKLMKTLNFGFFSKDLREYFMGLIKEKVLHREKNNVSRKDFLQLLLQIKNRGKLKKDDKLERLTDEENKITFEVLAAQIFLFFLVGIETSSPTMTFCLYELAKNEKIQEKARDHIKHVLAKHNEKLTYDCMSDMNYLDQIVHESLRKYPPLPMLQRVCIKNYKIPGSDIVLEKDTKVMISTMGIHRDPDYYPDPEKFDPNRFSEENKKSRPPFSFIPFGAGPRMCMGVNFGMMQLKVGLATLLLNYEFSVNSKTKEPITFDPEGFVPSVEGGVWLDFKKYTPST